MHNNNDKTERETAKSTQSFSRRTLLKAAGAGAAGAALAYGADKFGAVPGQRPKRPEIPKGRLTCRTNPRNGDRISLLGFGCMRLPVLPEATQPRGPDVDEAAAFRLIDYALAHGVNYYDTGWHYHRGMSEVVMGKALKRHPRNSYFMADKMPGVLNPTLDEAKNIFRTQLERCQTDYFDYYYLHGLRSLEGYKTVYEDRGVLDYLLEEKAAGRIRNLGWSFHGTEEMLEYLLSRDVQWDMALVQLNYHDLMHEFTPPSSIAQRFQLTPAQPRFVLEKMRKTAIPLLVMEPLLGGRLARLNRRSTALLQEEHPESSAASWAFRYVASLPNVLTVLSGMTYVEHIQDNLRTYSPWEPLSERELSVLEQALKLFVTQENIRCTGCAYCTPCPYGVDIPGVFTHYNNCVDDRYIPKGERNADYETARRAFLVGYDRSVPELMQAMRCTGCNQCTPRCPQEINIPEEMGRLSRFVEELRSEV